MLFLRYAEDDSDSDDETAESSLAKPDEQLTIPKDRNKKPSVHILDGIAAVEAGALTIKDHGVFIGAIENFIVQYIIDPACCKTPMHYLQSHDDPSPEAARIFLMYHLLRTTDPKHALNIFRAALVQCSMPLQWLLLDHLGFAAEGVFADSELESRPGYQFALKQMKAYCEKGDTRRQTLETRRAYLEHWLFANSDEQNAFSPMFKSGPLQKMGFFCTFVPRCLQQGDIVFLLFKNLSECFDRITHTFHAEAKQLIIIFMSAILATYSSGEGRKELVDRLIAHKQFNQSFSFPSFSLHPIAEHQFTDTKELRSVKKTLEAIIRYLPEDSDNFYAVITDLTDKSFYYQKVREVLSTLNKGDAMTASLLDGDLADTHVLRVKQPTRCVLL